MKRFTQAYLACVTAVDDNIGQVVNAIDNSKFKDNTIIVFVSDHGWTLGEKDHIYKNSPWEESTRVPLTIRAPGLTKPNSKVNHPVSLIDVYPTLLELAGLDNNTVKNSKGKSLDGFSLKPFLKIQIQKTGMDRMEPYLLFTAQIKMKHSFKSSLFFKNKRLEIYNL